MTRRPTPPADHPMTSYAEYMLDQIELLMFFTGISIAVMLLLLLAFTFFAVQKWWERAELKALNRNVVAQTATACALVATVEGWTVIHVEEERERKEAVAKATEDLKQTLPPATAAAVVQEIKRDAADSGVIKSNQTGSP